MGRETLVYVHLESQPHFVGRLWACVHKNRESASFEYDKALDQWRIRFIWRDGHCHDVEIVDYL